MGKAEVIESGNGGRDDGSGGKLLGSGRGIPKGAGGSFLSASDEEVPPVLGAGGFCGVGGGFFEGVRGRSAACDVFVPSLPDSEEVAGVVVELPVCVPSVSGERAGGWADGTATGIGGGSERCSWKTTMPMAPPSRIARVPSTQGQGPMPLRRGASKLGCGYPAEAARGAAAGPGGDDVSTVAGRAGSPVGRSVVLGASVGAVRSGGTVSGSSPGAAAASRVAISEGGRGEADRGGVVTELRLAAS